MSLFASHNAVHWGHQRLLWSRQPKKEIFPGLSFSTNAADARDVKNVCEKIATKLGIARVNVDEGVSKVSAVGVGMRTHTGIAATMFEALANAEINIENISTSEIVISCIVRREDGQRALRAIHDAFKLHEKNNAA